MEPVWVGIIVALVSGIVGTFLAFIGWIAREMYRVARTQERVIEQLHNLDARMKSLEVPRW